MCDYCTMIWFVTFVQTLIQYSPPNHLLIRCFHIPAMHPLSSDWVQYWLDGVTCWLIVVHHDIAGWLYRVDNDNHKIELHCSETYSYITVFALQSLCSKHWSVHKCDTTISTVHTSFKRLRILWYGWWNMRNYKMAAV